MTTGGGHPLRPCELYYLYAGKAEKIDSWTGGASVLLSAGSDNAYFFLLDERVEPPPNAFDQRAARPAISTTSALQ
jgi:hypothetical protein